MKNKHEISGVYETLRSFNGVFVFLPEHQARMQRSCEKLGFDYPNLAEIVAEFADFESGGDVRLRVEVMRDGGFEVQHFDLPRWHGSFLYDEIWSVKIFEGARENPGLKSTDTVMQAAAREAAEEEGCKEVILVDGQGRMTEGGITNVWFVEGAGEEARLVTPASGMLPGIARGLILQACEELGVEVAARDVLASELDNFEGVFLSNSIRGLIATEDGDLPEVILRVAQWCTREILRRRA